MTASTMGIPSTFTVLTVCTGNICRSPFAEAALRRSLIEIPSISVRSAGTHADDGRLAPPQALALASSRGLLLEGHRARYLDSAALSGVGLVLGLAREHRRATVETLPRATRFAFTLVEFARLITTIDSDELAAVTSHQVSHVDSLRAAVTLAASRRGSLPPTGQDDDVVDPFGHRDSVYETMASQIMPAADTVARYLASAVGALQPVR